MNVNDLLIYDGDCGFCYKSAKLIQRLTAVTIEPWQGIPEQMAALGLTDEDGMTQVWYVDKSGKLTGGAEAANAVMRQKWWFAPFSYLYYLPLMRQLQDAGYRWVARNRYQLPGGTPQCAVDFSAQE